MKYAFLFCIFILATNAIAQDILKSIPDDNRTYTPLPYSHLREADAMWTKRIWRIIDLNEKINLPLKYPLNSAMGERSSLINVICSDIRSGKLTPYGFEDDEFTMPISWEQIEKRGGARSEMVTMVYPDPPNFEYDTLISTSFDPDKVIGFLIKEDWFFDKERSEMDVRIIGIAPLIYAIDEDGNVREGNYKIPLFWIYYPDVRKLLANTVAFNRQGGAQRYSFDDLFVSRFFGSTIVKESNVYDRRIAEYKTGLNALLEADKIRNEIAEYESDLWEY